MAEYLGFEPTDQEKYFFISYNSEDHERVGRIAKKLSDKGIDFWYDKEIEYGSYWNTDIDEKVKSSQAVILFVTQGIFKKADSYVLVEWEMVKKYRKKVIPVFLDSIKSMLVPCDMEDFWKEIRAIQGFVSAKFSEDDLCEAIKNALVSILNSKAGNGFDRSKSKDKFGRYYKSQIRKFEEKKKADAIEGSESLKEAYIEACTEVKGKRTSMLKQVEAWFSEEDYGVLLLYGEPGHGKTTFCKKAVYEFAKGRRFDKASQVLWFPLNRQNPGLVDKATNALCIENILRKDREQEAFVNLEECQGMLIFLDGYDEVRMLLDHVKPVLKGYDDFKEYLLDLAADYDIHFVVTSRRNAIENPDAQKHNSEAFEFGLLTYEEQSEWCLARTRYKEYWRETLSSICKGTKEEEYLKNLYEILRVPFVFRMVAHQEYQVNGTVANRAGLYEDLFLSTMRKHQMDEQEVDKLEMEYQLLAYDIWCNNEDVATRHGKTGDLLLFSYYTKAKKRKQSKEIGFVHKSFYEYYLALYFYNQLKGIQAGKEEEYLSMLAERWLDPKKDVMMFFSEIAWNKQDTMMIKKASCVLKYANQVECMVPMIRSFRESSERSIYERCNNVFRNVLSICLMFDVVEVFNDLYNLKALIGKYLSDEISLVHKSAGKEVINGNKISLSQVDLWRSKLRNANLSNTDLSNCNLSYADLLGADLRKTNLSEANLSKADLRGADLRGACLRGANLRETNLCQARLQGANLRGANLSGAYLNSAFLNGANLSYSDLIEADLSKADLKKVNLRGADMVKVNLKRADLRNANLKQTNMFRINLDSTRISRKVLSEAKLLASDLRLVDWIPDEED